MGNNHACIDRLGKNRACIDNMGKIMIYYMVVRRKRAAMVRECLLLFCVTASPARSACQTRAVRYTILYGVEEKEGGDGTKRLCCCGVSLYVMSVTKHVLTFADGAMDLSLASLAVSFAAASCLLLASRLVAGFLTRATPARCQMPAMR